MIIRTQLVVLWIAQLLIFLLEIPLVAILIFDQFSFSDIWAALSTAGLLISSIL